MTSFVIHHQLLLDCHHLGSFPGSHVLLHKNAVLPWFILVPPTDAVDFLDLPEETTHAVMREAGTLAEFIKKTLGYPKVNFAAIGNVVPQMHLHIVGRRPGDPCWPVPVWGNLFDTREYLAEELREICAQLARQSPIALLLRQ